MSGNDEKPGNKDRVVKTIIYDSPTWVEAIPPEFRMTWRKVCEVCHRLVVDQEYWHEEHNVCIHCYDGASLKRKVLETPVILDLGFVFEDDDDEW